MFSIPEKWWIAIFVGISNISVIPIPITPETLPTIKVSALNTRDTSCFDAPMARRMPISFVRSSTDIYVIIPIIIEDTTRDIATKAIRMPEMTSMTVVMEDMSSFT